MRTISVDAKVAGANAPSTEAPNSHRWSRRIAVDLVGLLDVLAIVSGGLVPAAIYTAVGELALDWVKELQICLVSAVIAYGFLKNYGMYDTGSVHDLPVEPPKLAASLGITLVAMLGMGLPYAPGQMGMYLWYAAWLSTSFAFLMIERMAARSLLAHMTRTGVFDASVAVYGSGTVARRVEQHLGRDELGIRFAGRYDDRREPGRLETGPAICGGLDDLVAATRAGKIDRIVIALPQSAELRTRQIARSLEHLPVSLHVVTHIASDLVELGPAHNVSSLGSVGLIDVKHKPLADWGRVVKAIEDYVLASILVVLLAPLLALIAIAIKLDSKGPVIFRQRRRGYNHRIFEVLKFRTMSVLEDGAAVQQATRNDPRVTRVGRFLRKTSLDELPQLFNVLRGEMSIVGPRPHALAHDDHFGDTVDRYVNRQQVKPGITGLAQVSGFRGETETKEKIEGRLRLDLEYVNTWSLWLDIKILAMTAVLGFMNKNAY
ncbi:MAG: undecaprenyl-phosphate glucose phosphotransferase [Proteobacteria bacterium]|nr:undecaprenyl-phosphate glucose phosphotransferase [Pseudomonadota bacterium]